MRTVEVPLAGVQDLCSELQHLALGELRFDVFHAHGQQFFPAVTQFAAFCFVDVQEPHSDRIDHFDAISGIVEQGSKQLELDLVVLVRRDIEDHAINMKWRAVRPVHGHAMFLHPAYAAVLVRQAVFHDEGTCPCNRARDFRPHARAVLVQDQRLDRAHLARCQFILCVACHLDGHIAIHLHTPALANEHPVDHAGQILRQRTIGEFAFTQLGFHLHALGDVDTDADCICAIRSVYSRRRQTEVAYARLRDDARHVGCGALFKRAPDSLGDQRTVGLVDNVQRIGFREL